MKFFSTLLGLRPVWLARGFIMAACTVAGVCIAVAPASAQDAPTCTGLLFATGFNKEPTHGSKDALIDAVNRGASIRVGWDLDFNGDGTSDLTHWADANFLSIFEGEVFTQIDTINTQRPQRGQADIKLTDTYNGWRGSMGPNGRFEGIDANGNQFPEHIPSRVRWCAPGNAAPGWALLYRNGPDGEALAGSKQALFAAIRSGQPIQIAWGFGAERNGEPLSVEHLIEPVFLTIVNGSDVVAQMPEHIAQAAYVNPDRALFGDEPGVMWRGLMTTKGVFDAVWVNRGTGEMVRRYPQRAAMSWFAPAAPLLDTPTLAVPDGVRRDETRAADRFPPPQ